MTRWSIPAPLDFGWTMRERSSADISRRVLPDGRLEQIIRHALLPGITPELMLWWFQVIDQTVEFRELRCLAYRLWHPRDHVHFEIRGRAGDGSVRAGAEFHIVEAFGRRPEFLVDQWFRVPKLDRSGFRIEARIAGQVFLSVDEQWEELEEGLRWTNTMRAGLAGPLGVAWNPILRWRERRRVDAWLTHNVEEVGNLPLFLPELHRRMTATAS